MGRPVEEAWSLNSGDTTAIPSGNRSDGTASKWIDIWKYQVPTGQAHILKPSHHFCVYIDDGASQATAGKCRLKIVIRDASEQDEKAIYGPALYIVDGSFADLNKMPKLSLMNDLAVEEKFFIVIIGYSDSAIDESASYFKLETIRIRSSI